MPFLETGAEAPPFKLQDQTGREISLADFRGRPVVLYFYPADDTPGCTKEACSFRDRDAELKAAGISVLGVSPDDVASHAAFASKYGLPFTLLADPGHKVADAYGAWGTKSLYGKPVTGILRSTFLIGPDGKVLHVWKRPKTEIHADEVLGKLKGLLKP